MNRSSGLPTKQNTQYGSQWINGGYIVDNNLFSQIENHQDDASGKAQYYRAQTPEKSEFKNPHSSSVNMKRNQTNYNAPQSRYYQ